MYEVFTVDLQSEPNFEELISFDSLSVALAYSKVRILFSTFASVSVVWELGGQRKKLYRTFWHNCAPLTIEPGHELWYTDILLPFVLEVRGDSSGVQKRSRKRRANSFPTYRQS